MVVGQRRGRGLFVRWYRTSNTLPWELARSMSNSGSMRRSGTTAKLLSTDLTWRGDEALVSGWACPVSSRKELALRGGNALMHGQTSRLIRVILQSVQRSRLGLKYGRIRQ